uniref:Aspartate beta-hydroxylase domain containing 2 n=1 Tax=Pipistrellus kuhlii TaxID=59472 RepID=A0A7J7UFD1_PIPKU|nr:aspartate beta-hydroxylase domain containing 2 [Pipistrellus kuhlii]
MKVRRRMARGWCSWWTCGIRMWPRRNGRPWTSSLLRADENTSRARSAREAWGQPGRTAGGTARPGPAPALNDPMLRNLPRQKALLRGFYAVRGPSLLPLSVGHFRSVFP